MPCPSRLRSKGIETSHAANPKAHCNLQPSRDPLLRVQHDQSGKPEGRRQQRPDAQKVVRLFGQAIWTTKNFIGYFFDMFSKAKWLATKILRPAWQLTPGTRRAFPKHIRPASRDVSNDARSGNANRHDVIRCLVVQAACPKSLATFWASGRPSGNPSLEGTLRTPANKQSTSIIRHDCLDKGCKPCRNEAAFRHYLLFTMYAEQAPPANDGANLNFPRMRSFRSRTVGLAKPVGFEPF